MSASRTLRRKLLADQARRVERGRRIKPGTPRRRVRDISDQEVRTWFGFWPTEDTFTEAGFEADYHATKGLRVRRAGK